VTSKAGSRRLAGASTAGLPPDLVEGALNEWRREWPTLDFSPVSVVARLIRAVGILEPQLDDTLRQFGLNRATFDTLTALRRAGQPYQRPARELAERCMRTSATLTTRIARLCDAGLVTRTPDPRDARSVLITLTSQGRAVVDAAAPPYLAAEADLLAGLDEDERAQLSEILQVLLWNIEAADLTEGTLEHAIPTLGIRVEPAHVALRKRRSVGLPERVGLLVSAVEAGSVAGLAGVQVGDLLTEIAGQQLRSALVLNRLLAEASSSRAVPLTIARGADDITVEISPSRAR
jgi:DNA-binding MarR family transcriptional regulator